MAVFLALVMSVSVHLCLFAWFTSTPTSNAKKADKPIEITFVKPLKKKSTLVQVGDSENEVKPVIKSPKPSPVEKEKPKEIRKNVIPNPPVKPKVLAVPKAEQTIVETKVKVAVQKPKIKKVKKVEPVEPVKTERQKLSPELVNQQIADLATNVGFNHEQTNDSSVKYVDTFAGSQKSVAEQYKRQFNAKITRKFKEMYPEKDLSGSLNVSIEIKADGTISRLEISRASNPEFAKLFSLELKEAAEKTIYASVPFEPLPFELGTSVLGISQNWNMILQK